MREILELSSDEIGLLRGVQKKLGIPTKTRIFLRDMLLQWEPVHIEREVFPLGYYSLIIAGILVFVVDMIFRNPLSIALAVGFSVFFWFLTLTLVIVALESIQDAEKQIENLIDYKNLHMLLSVKCNDGILYSLVLFFGMFMLVDGMVLLWEVQNEAWECRTLCGVLLLVDSLAVLAFSVSDALWYKSRIMTRDRIKMKIFSVSHT